MHLALYDIEIMSAYDHRETPFSPVPPWLHFLQLSRRCCPDPGAESFVGSDFSH